MGKNEVGLLAEYMQNALMEYLQKVKMKGRRGQRRNIIEGRGEGKRGM
jgi:hypothetical protein